MRGLINYVYQLVGPRIFSVKYEDAVCSGKVMIRPKYMAICHADQRYYLGKRSADVLNKKLPMALIHECCGEVVLDESGNFKVGQKVVMIPNVVGTKKDGIYENYLKDSAFLSSGKDGFMREFVILDHDRVVTFTGIKEQVACISEFISVGVHAVNRFIKCSHNYKKTFGVWGDGSLSYTVCNILRNKFPNSRIFVIGKSPMKLSLFSFVDETYLVDELPQDFEIDHAFECVGGGGSSFAIDDIIKYINPQGTVMLMGVSESLVPIKTRDILEKGLTFIGSSRSGREDFEGAVKLLQEKNFRSRFEPILYEDKAVCNVDDIHRVFNNDLNTPFKTVFEWRI